MLTVWWGYSVWVRVVWGPCLGWLVCSGEGWVLCSCFYSGLFLIGGDHGLFRSCVGRGGLWWVSRVWSFDFVLPPPPWGLLFGGWCGVGWDGSPGGLPCLRFLAWCVVVCVFGLEVCVFGFYW